MDGYVREAEGGLYRLPPLQEWKLCYTAGTPCDSFSVVCGYGPDMARHLKGAAGFQAADGTGIVFTGVVDEVEVTWDGDGRRTALHGRGMAALLLDNEAEPEEYGTATLDDILERHVLPYGIQVGERAALPGVPGFAVASGSSQWQVLYQFARYYGGVTPRFDRRGRLLLTGWPEGPRRVLDDSAPVTAALWREKRYGVLSEVLVRSRNSRQRQRVVNQEFLDQGGQCRRVLTTPNQTGYQAMRYSGQFQLDRSQAEWRRLEVTVASLFWGWPGELVEAALERYGLTGTWRILEAEVSLGEAGGQTRLTLGELDAVI